jgi:Flp pilus assembly protein TadD
MLEATSPATRAQGQVQLLFAQLALGENRSEVALNHLQTAVRSKPRDAAMFNQLGWAFLGLQRWAEAAEAFQKSLEIEPENPGALDGLARLHLQNNEPQSAVERALQAVGLIHYFPEAHFHLGTGLDCLGKTSEAILAYETALGMGYHPALLHRRLAELYGPINPQKAAAHVKALNSSRRVYQADIKSTLS